MPNYGIFTNCVLQELIQKGEISARKKRKSAIAAVYVATEICVS